MSQPRDRLKDRLGKEPSDATLHLIVRPLLGIFICTPGDNGAPFVTAPSQLFDVLRLAALNIGLHTEQSKVAPGAAPGALLAYSDA
eukprot:115386-Chlamydomonas_euryale.AAC.1